MKKHVYQSMMAVGVTLSILAPGAALAQEVTTTSAPESAPTGTNANTGLSTGVIGNGSMQTDDTGIGVNGNVTDSNLNNNQNTLRNQNQIISQPVLIAPSSPGGRGGNSAMVMPRNPLPMPNAALGRSNFGLQFGVQNNPGLGALLGGNENALGWFMQAGLTIPFGKIPDVYRNPSSAKLDDLRQERMAGERNVFANIQPQQNKPSVQTDQRVKGRVMGLSAYNYTSIPSAKIGSDSAPAAQSFLNKLDIPQPKVLALAPAEVYTRPLNTGEKLGSIEVGKEYPYLGHTKSGWVKVLLPNGAEGWASTQFEYIKFDYTQIDNLATDPSAGKPVAVVPSVKETSEPVQTEKKLPSKS